MPWLKTPFTKQPGFLGPLLLTLQKDRCSTGCEVFTQILLMADGFVFHSLSVNFRGGFSQTATVHHESRGSSGLYSLRCGPWHRLNGRVKKKSTKTTERCGGGHRDWQRREDRQTWFGDRMKERRHITVSRTKTPKATLLQCPSSWKNTPQHESQGILSALLKNADRGESQYTLELGEANSNTAMLRQTERAELGDRLTVGKEERMGKRTSKTGLVSIMLSVWNPKSVLL